MVCATLWNCLEAQGQELSHTSSHSFLSVAALHHANQDKFERHLISVARKCQDQDDAVDKALQEVEEAEEKRFPQKRIMNNCISMMLQSHGTYQKIQNCKDSCLWFCLKVQAESHITAGLFPFPKSISAKPSQVPKEKIWKVQSWHFMILEGSPRWSAALTYLGSWINRVVSPKSYRLKISHIISFTFNTFWLPITPLLPATVLVYLRDEWDETQEGLGPVGSEAETLPVLTSFERQAEWANIGTLNAFCFFFQSARPHGTSNMGHLYCTPGFVLWLCSVCCLVGIAHSDQILSSHISDIDRRQICCMDSKTSPRLLWRPSWNWAVKHHRPVHTKEELHSAALDRIFMDFIFL